MSCLIWQFPIVECLLRFADCKTHQALRLTHRNFLLVSSLANAKLMCRHRNCEYGVEWCQCDCLSMRHHRIQTAVRNWRCSVHSPCVQAYDKTDRVKYLNRVCRACFKAHWIKTAMRPDSFCLK
jgi:hypothetical protein